MAPFVPMPETAMNKNDHVVFWQHQIRFARQILSVKSVAEACGMQESPDGHLGLSVFTLDGRHHFRTSRFINNISHWMFFSGK